MSERRITLPFLQKVFSAFYPEVVLKSYNEAPGSKRGDNYTSSLYRVEVYGVLRVHDVETDWKTSIICKCLPDSSARREAFKSDLLFHNEMVFYTKVVPLFNEFLQNSRERNKSLDFIPKCYFAEDDLIILEDLRLRGFNMADRKLGLNQKQMSQVLVDLAFFHALSLAVKICCPDKFCDLIQTNEGIHEGLFVAENKEWYKEYYLQATSNALQMVEMELQLRNIQGDYLNKFREFADGQFFNRMVQLVSQINNLAVLCHGDCWANNILFKKTPENDNLEVFFIDFQLCRYGSLALDLSNLIFCCTTRKLRDLHLKSLFDQYYQSLIGSLSSFLKNTNYADHELLHEGKLLSLLKVEFRRCAAFGLGLALDILPISTCDSDQAPDMYEHEEEDDDEVKRLPVFTSNDMCRIKMTNLLCDLVDHKLI